MSRTTDNQTQDILYAKHPLHQLICIFKPAIIVCLIGNYIFKGFIIYFSCVHVCMYTLAALKCWKPQILLEIGL